MPPFSVKEIIEKYATVIFDDIPGVDGVSLNIKVPDKTPTVVVNSTAPKVRQRFTMAHELGHIIIPWHIGTLIADVADGIELSQSEHEAAYAYWELEKEANRFAAELLMPQEWLSEQVPRYENIAELHEFVVKQCNVSAWTSAIKLALSLPPHIVFCAESNNEIQYSGRSEGTFANPLLKGSFFSKDLFPDSYYPYSTDHYTWRSGGNNIHWWRLPSTIDSTTTDIRNWKKIQEDIIVDISYSGNITELKHSLNGIIGSANSMYMRLGDDYNAEGLVAACMQRFHNRDEVTKFVEHPDFKIFLQKRAVDIINKALSK